MPDANDRRILKNRYSLAGRLGGGGMATVYRAFDLDTHQQVAIKCFKIAERGPIAEGSYRVELDALKGLRHPNIVDLIDDGADENGHPFLVLELFDTDLRTAREKNPNNWYPTWQDFFQSIANPILDAIYFGHLKGITHRDITPNNILLRSNCVKLADFGIARIKGRFNSGQTLRGYRTEPFAPPEVDDGSYSDSRDVFAFAAVCVWALSKQEVINYPDLYMSLRELPIPDGLREIFGRCMHTDPGKRYLNGSALKLEIDTFLRQFKAAVQVVPKRLHLGLSRRALDVLRNMADLEPMDFFEQDVNSNPTITRYFRDDRPEPLHFVILGGRLSYHIAFSDDWSTATVLNVAEPDPSSLLRRKDSQPGLPVAITTKGLLANVPVREAHDLIDKEISTYELNAVPEEDELPPILQRCSDILAAKYEIEESRQPPVAYTDLVADGRIISVKVSEPNRFAERDCWLIRQDRGITSLSVMRTGETDVDFLVTSRTVKPNLPRRGTLTFDLTGTKQSLDRQRSALDQLITKSTANHSFANYLDDLQSLPKPEANLESISDLSIDLDDPKRRAIAAVLSQESLVVVPGPPGTGKTRFIAYLIGSFKKRRPNARILLTAQTHVAIDNAIEKTAQIFPNTKILRISSDGDVPGKIREFLLDKQMASWKSTIEKQSEAWIRTWSQGNQVNIDEVMLGCDLAEFARLKESETEVRAELSSIREELQKLRSESRESASQEENILITQRRQSSLRDKLKHLQSEAESIGQRVKKRSKENAKYLEQSVEVITEFANRLIGRSVSDSLVRQAIDLRSEWLSVFGTTSMFNAAICERSDVVAGTCIGFAGLAETELVEYDLCIIDEASKATALETIVPMVRAKQWVLVGDSKQLPPFKGYYQEAIDVLDERGVDLDSLSESLFSILEKQLPQECIHTLSNQYRMNAPIGSLVADCFYPGVLNAGHRAPIEELRRVYSTSVVWHCTSSYGNRKEHRSRTSYENSLEKQLIVDALVKIDAKVTGQYTVLILSPYLAQVEALSDAISVIESSLKHLNVKCSTIDAVQGKEADIVMFSLTRTPPTTFVDDPHRVNVALSRAKELLIVVGDSESVRKSNNCENLKRVLEHIESHRETCSLLRELLGRRI